MNNSFNPLGVDLFGDPVVDRSKGALAAKYEVPPFSTLSARDGSWQERKRAWINLGIKSELGRGAELIPTVSTAAYGGADSFAGNRGGRRASPGGSLMPAADYSKGERGDSTGKPLSKAGAHNGAAATIKRQGGTIGFDGSKVLEERNKKANSIQSGEDYGGSGPAHCTGATSTSIFDPVLCELMYRWFSPEAAQVVDPFAGGSVRGLVAALLGRKYWGCDLSKAQIDANYQQARDILGIDEAAWPKWYCGDSAEVLTEAPECDFILSCPPYGDLEVYSDDPRDLSTMKYCDFLASYSKIIGLCAAKLKPECMACFVVGDFRDKKTGLYRGFVADTINIFREYGLGLYNDAVLLTSIGSLPVRISGQFEKSRKLGKAHQNVLVFKKTGGNK